MIDPTDNTMRGIGPSSTTPTGNSKLGKDEFLKLLMTQLANQDPTAPQSSEAFVAQLAQFASLEVAQQTNNQLEAILIAQAGANQLASVNLVGKDATFETDKISLQNGAFAPREALLSGNADSITVVVKDAKGKTVSTQTLDGPFEGGRVSLGLSIENAQGQIPSGDYTITATAQTKDAKNVDMTVIERGRVSGITYENGYPELLINGTRLALGDVISLFEPGGADSELQNPSGVHAIGGGGNSDRTTDSTTTDRIPPPTWSVANPFASPFDFVDPGRT